jgi:hypothetical protein
MKYFNIIIFTVWMALFSGASIAGEHETELDSQSYRISSLFNSGVSAVSDSLQFAKLALSARDPEARIELMKKYYHWKLDSLRATSSIKRRTCDWFIKPVLYSLSGLTYAPTTGIIAKRLAATYLLPSLFSIPLDYIFRAGEHLFGSPDQTMASRLEGSVHSAAIVERLQKELPKIVDLAFKGSIEKPVRVAKNESSTWKELLQMQVQAKLLAKQYYHSKLDAIRLTSSLKGHLYNSLYAFVIEPALFAFNIGGMFNLPVTLGASLVSGYASSWLFDQSIESWDNMHANPDDGIAGTVEGYFHPSAIVDGLHVALEAILEEKFTKAK